MWGNHLADRSAAGELNFTTVYCYQNLWSNRLSLTPLPSLDAITLTSALAPPHLWYFGNRKKQLISPSAMDRIHQRGLDRYLVSRDKERWDRAKLPAKWQYINMHLAAKLWKMSSHGPMMCMKNRLMFDKHMHQGNLAKGVRNPKDAEAVAKCPFCIEQDSQEHWAINCSACSRTVNIRREALIHIRKMISTETSQHKNSGAKSSISSFGELYLSFLEGPTRSVGAWMGEWTSDQLGSFASRAYISPTTVTALRRLFLDIGCYLAETIIKIWQSRQLATVELAGAMSINPSPLYVEPVYLHDPANPNLPSLSQKDLDSMTASALQVVRPPSSPVRYSHTTKRRLRFANPPAAESSSTAGVLPPPLVDLTSTSGGASPPVEVPPSTTGEVYSSFPHSVVPSSYEDLSSSSLISLAPSNSPSFTSSLSPLMADQQPIPAVPTNVKMMVLKVDTFVRPKAHPQLSILQKENRIKMGAPITRKREKERRAAPIALVPITSLLMSPASLPLLSPPQICLAELPSSCPPSPPKHSRKRRKPRDSTTIVRVTSPPQYIRKAVPLVPFPAPSPVPVTLGSLSRDSLKRTTEAHCPVRGHDPG